MAAQAEPVVAEKKSRSRKAEPPTFADIARKKIRAHLETYRALLRRHADGESLSEDDLSTVADTLEALGLPDWCWPRDLEALGRHDNVWAKFKAAVDAEPANRDRAVELAKEIESARARLATLLEEHRKAQTGSHKSVTYSQTLSQLAVEHAHVLADIDTAVTLRLDELNRRKREGVS